MVWDYVGELPKQIVYSGSGQGGPGISDAIAFTAVLKLLESIDQQSDNYTGYVRGSYSETNVSQTDTYSAYIQGFYSETNSTLSDLYSGAIQATYNETLVFSDNYSGVLKGTYSDSNVSPTDAYSAIGRATISDSVPGQTDSRSTRTRTWVTSTSTSGTAPTNPANVTGAQDGVNATVKGNGGLSPSTSTLVATIPVASIPAGGTKTLNVWYSANVGVGDTATVTFQNTSGVPASGSISTGTIDYSAAGAPYSLAITNIGTAFTVTFSNTGALLGGTGILADAACIITTGI